MKWLKNTHPTHGHVSNRTKVDSSAKCIKSKHIWFLLCVLYYIAGVICLFDQFFFHPLCPRSEFKLKYPWVMGMSIFIWWIMCVYMVEANDLIYLRVFILKPQFSCFLSLSWSMHEVSALIGMFRKWSTTLNL